MHIGQFRIERHQGIAQGIVERVDRAVTNGDAHQAFVAHTGRDRRFRFRHQLATGVATAVVHHAEPVTDEIFRHLPQGLAHQQLEARLRPVIRIAFEFLVLHRAKQPGDHFFVFDDDIQLFQSREDIRPSGLIGHHDQPLVADQGRFDMFVGARVLRHGGNMQPALVRKGAFADIGLMPVG